MSISFFRKGRFKVSLTFALIIFLTHTHTHKINDSAEIDINDTGRKAKAHTRSMIMLLYFIFTTNLVTAKKQKTKQAIEMSWTRKSDKYDANIEKWKVTFKNYDFGLLN